MSRASERRRIEREQEAAQGLGWLAGWRRRQEISLAALGVQFSFNFGRHCRRAFALSLLLASFPPQIARLICARKRLGCALDELAAQETCLEAPLAHENRSRRLESAPSLQVDSFSLEPGHAPSVAATKFSSHFYRVGARVALRARQKEIIVISFYYSTSLANSLGSARICFVCQ